MKTTADRKTTRLHEMAKRQVCCRRIRRQKHGRMRAGRPERACGADLVRCALLRSAREDSAISGTCAWRSAANVLRDLLWECMMIYHAPAPVHGRSAGACPPCTLAGQTPARDSIKECGTGKKGARAWDGCMAQSTGKRPAYLRNTNFLCSAKYEPWGMVGVPDWSLRGNNDAERSARSMWV